MKNKKAQTMQKLSSESQRKRLGEEAYRKMMKKNSLKGVKKREQMRKDGRLVLRDGRWRKKLSTSKDVHSD